MKNQWLWFFTQRNKWCNAKGLAPSGVNTVFEQDYATAHWRQNADGTWFSKWKVSTYNCSGIPKNYPYNGGYCLYMGQCYPGPFDNYNAHLYYDRIKCWISYNYNSVNWHNQIIRNKYFKFTMPMVQSGFSTSLHYIMTIILLNYIIEFTYGHYLRTGQLADSTTIPHQMSTHGFDSTSLSLKRPRQCVAGLGWLLDPCFTPLEE